MSEKLVSAGGIRDYLFVRDEWKSEGLKSGLISLLKYDERVVDGAR